MTTNVDTTAALVVGEIFAVVDNGDGLTTSGADREGML
jgi:hypothetical protein